MNGRLPPNDALLKQTEKEFLFPLTLALSLFVTTHVFEEVSVPEK